MMLERLTRHPFKTLFAVGWLTLSILLLFGELAASAHRGGLAGGHQASAYDCNHGSPKWSPRQNQCLVAYLFRHEPAVGREAARIITCESGWDENQITPPFAAGGLSQFIPSTWRRTPYARRDRLDPVWNVRAMRWLYHHDGDSWREWSCSRILGIR